ncbi:hypothetical protein [Alkalihalobacillus sp. R86527]|uniref:hypothetical protein n=1 Tax=Alkalihalobacillus sp. R86527 TaxID=3093863 RepID=UPI00366BAFBA
MAQEKLLNQSNRNLSKAQRAAREEAESQVVTNQTTPKQNNVVKNSKPMRALFNQLKKYNDHFTEADSIALNTLTFNLYMKAAHEEELTTMDMLDDNYERFMIRLEKFNKQITESMKQLCIPLNARLSLANEMTKVIIEEKKLAQMEGPKQEETNPLLAVLEATKNVK